jgi:hypothetical protein
MHFDWDEGPCYQLASCAFWGDICPQPELDFYFIRLHKNCGNHLTMNNWAEDISSGKLGEDNPWCTFSFGGNGGIHQVGTICRDKICCICIFLQCRGSRGQIKWERSNILLVELLTYETIKVLFEKSKFATLDRCSIIKVYHNFLSSGQHDCKQYYMAQ